MSNTRGTPSHTVNPPIDARDGRSSTPVRLLVKCPGPAEFAKRRNRLLRHGPCSQGQVWSVSVERRVRIVLAAASSTCGSTTGCGSSP